MPGSVRASYISSHVLLPFTSMSLYTTPLQLGYFFSLIMWLVLLIRGVREQRLSDKLLGWIMFILAMELQDYTFGFAGINILWNELNGFPRGVSFLFGPIVYFYFRAQVNRSFRIKGIELWHFLPYFVYFFYDLSAFVQGPAAVEMRQQATYDLVMSYLARVALLISFIYYLSRCLRIYRSYRKWSLHQFSNTELIHFKWFRNFLYGMIFWLVFREAMNIVDAFLDLDFYQDWWWNLALVVVAFYIGLAGYAQKQPARIFFQLRTNEPAVNTSPKQTALPTGTNEQQQIAEKLTHLMQEDRLFLQPDLNLQELAQHLQINAVQLSATINTIFDLNFNDYINSLRIEEFIRLYEADKKKRFTILAIALDSGFNSKATFNRAFKKIKGSSPKDYLNLHVSD